MEKTSCDGGYDNVDGEIESMLIRKPLFIINLDPQPNQQVVECMADKKLWAKRQLHPIILSFLDEEQDKKIILCMVK